MKRNISLELTDTQSYLDFIALKEMFLCEGAAYSKDACYAWVPSGQGPKIDLGNYSLKTHSFRSPFHIDSDMITYSKYGRIPLIK